MNIGEYPLFNHPALMLMMLKAASEGPVTIADCYARLNEALTRAHERPPDVPRDLIVSELAIIRDHLAAALLVNVEGDRLALTQRGRHTLQRYPMGIDETTLMQFPEYRAFIRTFARRRTIDDPRVQRYDEGYAAQQAGQVLTENPYPPDTADHLAWENGWSEARDAGAECHRGGS